MLKTFLLEKNMTLEKICINCIHCISMSINELKNSKVRLFLQVFFTGLERKFGHNCFCIIMSVGNKDIGFVLIIQGTDIIIPFLMGIDYKYRELHVWHNLTIECVRYAIETRVTNIDLGLTNFELKKRLGAKKININMFARFKNNVVNRFCKSFLSKLL